MSSIEKNGLPAPRTGKSNGASRGTPFDRWYRYPAGFSREALGHLFDSDRLLPTSGIVDPFTGAGTVGTEARANGHNFFGIEAHPEIAQLAALKLRRPPQRDLLAAARALVTSTSTGDLELEHELVRRCFEDSVLSRLAGLRNGIPQAPKWSQDYFKWALLGSLRDLANVKVGWPYLRPAAPRKPPYVDPDRRFLERLNWMVDDLRATDGVAEPTMKVVHSDSTLRASWNRGPSGFGWDACLTSPPYLNNFDYADATRLEMYFWGRNRSWIEMTRDVRAGMVVATTQQSSVDSAAAALKKLKRFPSLHKEVESLTARLAKERRARSRGKEYDNVLPKYLYDMSQVLAQARRSLRPGAWSGWVVGDSAPYGVYVDTPELLLTAAEELGFVRGESEVIRARGTRWATNSTRHQVPLDERVIWFRQPL